MRSPDPAWAAPFMTFGAACAVAGGGLRVASSFIPWSPASPWLETLYGVIDLCLLFALVAVYLRAADGIGLAGLFFFVVSLGAQASIVGPDPTVFGIDFYQAGAAGLLIGLAGLSVQLLRARALAIPSILWLASVAAGFGSAATGSPTGALAAGAVLGLGFMWAGALMLRSPFEAALRPAS